MLGLSRVAFDFTSTEHGDPNLAKHQSKYLTSRMGCSPLLFNEAVKAR